VKVIGSSVDRDRDSLELAHDATDVRVERSTQLCVNRWLVAFCAENHVEKKIRKRVGHRDSRSFAAPRLGLNFGSGLNPTACAVGYILSPLRG
jgi:hypothetical protein